MQSISILAILSLTFTTSMAIATPQISIYYSLPNNQMGTKVLEDGENVASPLMRFFLRNATSHHNAHKTLKSVADFFENQFGLKGYDGQNSEIKAIVGFARISIFSDLKELRQNAAWYEAEKVFLLGSGGKILDHFEKELDVMTHEYTHAIIDSHIPLLPIGQSGALNESLADIFAQLADDTLRPDSPRWVIGENVLTQQAKDAVKAQQNREVVGLRDMLNPEKGLTPQPRHMGQIPAALGPSCAPTRENDMCGIHFLTGIPSRAAALMVNDLGWNKMKNIFYQVMTKELVPDSDFADFALKTYAVCTQKLSAQDCQKVAKAFYEVGLYLALDDSQHLIVLTP